VDLLRSTTDVGLGGPTLIPPVADVENVVFEVASALRVPVLVLALAALLLVLLECGAVAIELWRRRRRAPDGLREAAVNARGWIARGDRANAAGCLGPIAWSGAMWQALLRIVADVGEPEDSIRLPKSIADFDLVSLRRLERTRILVRVGPALGLMGTLIPLAPALQGLAEGNTQQLTENLRVAFSVTVLGLVIGALAFGISLIRDRLYAQDLSDLKFVAATLEAGFAR
jgi:biopolymer transport protein ExbB/TolQ